MGQTFPIPQLPQTPQTPQIPQATSANGLPNGPLNFSTYQLAGTSNNISVNLAGLQSCMANSSGNDLINNCISNNISALNNQTNSYQNIKYVGPGHNLDSANNVTFGQIQPFQNINDNNCITKNTLIIYIIIVMIYLFIMLQK